MQNTMSSTLPAERSVTSNSAPVNRSLMGIRIVGTGCFAPDFEVTNDDLAPLGFDADWIEQRTGILSRRHAPEDMASSDMAIRAARACIADAKVDPSEIDLIIVATMTPDHYTPSTACLVQQALGCQASAVDMNAACSGFIYGFITASQFVRSGSSRLALVIGADKMSCVCDDRDKKTFPLFGDGAGAALITLESGSSSSAAHATAAGPHYATAGDDVQGRSESGAAPAQGILAFRLASVGELSHTLVVPGGGSRKPCSEQVVADRDQFLKMEGKAVFKWAVRLIPEVIDQICADAGLDKQDIDLFILHQANKRILDAAIDNMGMDPNRFFCNLQKYGNTSAGSIPVALDEARKENRIPPGSKVLMFGFGAGLSWGAAVIQF